jgi:hypothetical protein
MQISETKSLLILFPFLARSVIKFVNRSSIVIQRPASSPLLDCLSFWMPVPDGFQIISLDMLQTSTAYVRGTACTSLQLGTGP